MTMKKIMKKIVFILSGIILSTTMTISGSNSNALANNTETLKWTKKIIVFCIGKGNKCRIKIEQ